MAEENKQTVYIETSIVSYLMARPSGDLLAAAWQKITADWWETQRTRFDLCTSRITIEESGRGDPQAAARRLDALTDIPILPVTEEAIELSVAILRAGALPSSAQADSLHIAVAATNGVHFLLTWNFRHLANAANRAAAREVCSLLGYTSPEICSPQDLFGEI